MFRFLLSLIYILALPAAATALLHFIGRLAAANGWLAYFAAGAALGILLDRFLRRHFPSVSVFEHELTHAVAALLFLRRVTDFTVTSHSGGSVSHSGGRGGRFGDDIIGLAPYVLPTFMALFVLLRPLFPPGQGHPPWFLLLVGCMFGYHAISTWHETKLAWKSPWFASAGGGEMVQSDIARRGFLYSAISIATLSCLIHGLLFAVLLDGYRGLPLWWNRFWPALGGTIGAISTFVNRSVLLIQRLLA